MPFNKKYKLFESKEDENPLNKNCLDFYLHEKKKKNF